jgi:hypothetical protein
MTVEAQSRHLQIQNYTSLRVKVNVFIICRITFYINYNSFLESESIFNFICLFVLAVVFPRMLKGLIK